MLLAIDIGNTNITLGVYKGDAPGPRWRFAAGREKMPDEYGALILSLCQRAGISANDISAIVMASVVPPLKSVFVEACIRYFQIPPMVVDGRSNTGIRIKYDDLEQAGADRIVNAAAGYRLYGGPACIVDFGTATTFDAVSAEGDFLGGAIAPGIRISAEALFQRAAKLPKVDFVRPPAAIGKNMAHSLQSGLLFGYVGLVEGILARMSGELGSSTKVIATGGLAEVVARETVSISIVAPWLTLEGLRIIYSLNSA